jgi:hypothetical protein
MLFCVFWFSKDINVVPRLFQALIVVSFTNLVIILIYSTELCMMMYIFGIENMLDSVLSCSLFSCVSMLVGSATAPLHAAALAVLPPHTGSKRRTGPSNSVNMRQVLLTLLPAWPNIKSEAVPVAGSDNRLRWRQGCQPYAPVTLYSTEILFFC